jgi:hypothetical protein
MLNVLILNAIHHQKGVEPTTDFKMTISLDNLNLMLYERLENRDLMKYLGQNK